MRLIRRPLAGRRCGGWKGSPEPVFVSRSRLRRRRNGLKQWVGGKVVKLEKLAVSLDEQELLELEAIVQDGDEQAALQFLRRLRQRIQRMQAKSVRP